MECSVLGAKKTGSPGTTDLSLENSDKLLNPQAIKSHKQKHLQPIEISFVVCNKDICVLNMLG